MKQIGHLLILLSILGWLFVGFSHPELTERQLLIMYWNEYLVIVLATVLATVIGIFLRGENK